MCFRTYKPNRRQLAKVKPEKWKLFEQCCSWELILYDAAARCLKELKYSGEEIPPKAWQREIDLLLGGQSYAAMQMGLKAIERLRTAFMWVLSYIRSNSSGDIYYEINAVLAGSMALEKEFDKLAGDESGAEKDGRLNFFGFYLQSASILSTTNLISFISSSIPRYSVSCSGFSGFHCTSPG